MKSAAWGTDKLSERILFGHPYRCPCCSERPDHDGSRIGELLLAENSAGPLFAGPAASNQTLATYLRSGFWTDWGSSARKFNLSSSGINAKNGVLTYNTTGNTFDSNGLSSARQHLVDEAFKLFEAALGIDFQSTSDVDADFRFGDEDSGAYASSSFNSGKISYVDINVASSWHSSQSGFGNYTFQTVIHEIGHGLGLGHQGSYNAGGGVPITYSNNAQFANDSWQSTMMSYFDQNENTSITATLAYLSTPMSVDWIALDDLYSEYGHGVNNAFLGDTIYGFNTNIEESTSEIFAKFKDYASSTAFTLVDGSGTDTLDLSGFSNNQTIDLRATDSTLTSLYPSNVGGNTGNLTIATGTVIENAVGGSGGDSITGNSANNSIDGGSGNDTMAGGSGDDIYVVDSATDVVNESSAEGTDLIQTFVTYTLPANTEHITLIGGSAITGSGNTLNNTLTGNEAPSTLAGAAGDDTYVISNASNVVTESASAGTDHILSSVSYTLPANTEHITLTGSSNINATGNSLDNTLTGNSGNNTLDGSTGSDTMAGGAGDDSYIVDSATDVVNESSAEGTDHILSSVSFSTPDNIENLSLTGSGNINATGNSLDNTLTGNSGNNTLDGGAGNDTLDGSTGSDTMAGGAGDDSYIVDSATDVVNESSAEGTDHILSSVSYTLPANTEHITLTGSSNINATGNSLNNTLTGNSGNNTLDGGAGNNTLDGSTGNDTMTGGAGDDSYIVDSATDVVNESSAEGTDHILSSVSYTLPANTEHITLTGSSNINATGNSLNNTLTGNSGNNTLDGGAGNDTLDGSTGNDTMAGGAGDDSYIVDSATDVVNESSAEGTDHILSSVSFSTPDNVENLSLTGSGNINATGNSLNNTLTGNSGNNTLDGSTGSDTMAGGAGDDSYIVDSATDVVNESSAEGTDHILSSVSFSTPDNVENLSLTGSGNINATGNSLNNTLTGNSGNNTLDGSTGNDTMAGGAGDDSYIVDSATDVVNESSAEGTDHILSSVSFSTSDNVEKLSLTGSGNINATGNSLNNTLTGNSGNNTLDGSTGNDTMAGGAGDDSYIVDSATDVVNESSAEGTDHILSSVSFSTPDNVEKLSLTGSGNINATGNSLNNTLDGGAGNDTLDGSTGNDTMAGGAGDDSYIVDSATDVVNESSAEGTDHILSSVSFSTPDNVENLSLTGSGNINATGNSLNNTLTGNSGNNTLDGSTGSDTMAGGAGDDSYIVDSATDVVNESSAEGTDHILSSVSFSTSNNVEKLSLTGSGNINATGNSLDNTLTGNSGNNTLNGSTGSDTMAGGAGDDSYIVDSATDVVNESSAEGTDHILSSVSFSTSDNVEKLSLTGSGNINATGNSLDNTLTGNSGNNTLNGSTGSDTMAGGAGDDSYIVDSATDVVNESSAEGTDHILSSVSFSTPDNVENLSLTGSGNINATGNSLNNTLTGNSGNNTLDGSTGSDTMAGGAGDDSYIVDSATDVVNESSAEGTDHILSSVSFSTSNNVENLSLTGSGNINATGNSLDNTLTGNSGNNTLNGSTGSDTMAGGAGDDSYIVDSATDVVNESSAEGTDHILSSVSFSTPDNVENLSLTGSGNINATGNSLNNTLTGNSGNNTLNGSTGNDTMAGGAGDDSYIVDSATDVVNESSAEGTDHILSSVSFSTPDNVEKLSLTGSGNINATGNSLDNTLTGNSGNNTLDGSTGNDTMAGGDGDDEFRISSGRDLVTDFTSGADKVGISQGEMYALKDINGGNDMKIKTSTGAIKLANITQATFNTSTDAIFFGSHKPTTSSQIPMATFCKKGICSTSNKNVSIEFPASQFNSLRAETLNEMTTVTSKTIVKKLEVVAQTNMTISGEDFKKPTFILNSLSKATIKLNSNKMTKAVINAQAAVNNIIFSGNHAKSSIVNGEDGKEQIKIQRASELTGKSTMKLGSNKDKVILDGIIHKLKINNGKDTSKDTIAISNIDNIQRRLEISNFGEEDRLLIENSTFSYNDVKTQATRKDLKDLGIAIDLISE